jgi:hypothetical protein
MTKEIAFHEINICPRKHIYIRNILCIYGGSQVERERTDRHAPSTKKGPPMSRKKKKNGCRPPILRKKGLPNGRKKVPLDGRKNGVHPGGKRRGPTLSLLDPTPDREKALRSLTPITNPATRYDELAGGVDPRIGKWSTQTRREVNN